ncbi:hypothetical protein V8E52_005141, partial [Russula decolorans]
MPYAIPGTWVSMWSLDKDDGKGVEEAVCCVHDLMLKLQCEGGRNNIHWGNIPPFVMQMPQQEHMVWVAMHRAPEQCMHTLSPRDTCSSCLCRQLPTSRSRLPQNPSPRPHVQIPPTRYSALDSAPPHLATLPTTGGHQDIPHAETYSPRATSTNPAFCLASSIQVNKKPQAFCIQSTQCFRLLI